MTQHMTKKALVLSMSADVPAGEVARQTGIAEDYVRTIRWIHQNPERKKAQQRATYQRWKDNNQFGGIEGGRWQPADDIALIKLLRAGKSYTECGKAFRVTRNCVAGRVHRLRQEGRL